MIGGETITTAKTKSQWPPAIPARLAKVMALFTRDKDGWVKWYKGSSRRICGKLTPLERVPDLWEARKREIDGAMRKGVATSHAGKTLREAASDFYQFLDYRVANGQPEPMAEATAEDYKATINSFGRCIGSDLDLGSICQPHFKKYAATFAGAAPSSFARAVAYIKAFFRWSKDEGLIQEIPTYGRYFVRPSLQAHRDERLSHKKSYTSQQIQLLYFHATFEEKIWILLGLNGALDNSDIGHLTEEVFDQKNGVIDYRRRKRGLIRRVIPIRPEVLELLKIYRRPEPADPQYADRIFLTPTGLPLQRFVESESGRRNPVDYMNMCWTRLMIRAGLRPALPPRARKKESPRREKRSKTRGVTGGQGFRALRTTFANFTPRGYRDEREIIMGHSGGGVLLENYLEEFGAGPLRELVDAVFHRAFFPVTLPASYFVPSGDDRIMPPPPLPHPHYPPPRPPSFAAP